MSEQAAAAGRSQQEEQIYAEAIVRTVRQPLLVLSSRFVVEAANPAFYRTFQVRPEETEGRPIHELGNRQWNIPALRKLLKELLPAEGYVEDFRVEHDFEQIGRRVMLLNAHRMVLADRPDRILLAIDDITERERIRFELEGQKEFAEKVVNASRDALLILEWDLRVRSANETFYTKFKVDPTSTEGRLVYELGNSQWDIPRLRDLLENVLPENDAFDDFIVEHDFQQIGRRIMLLNARKIDHMRLILLAIEDITERTLALDALQASEHRLRTVLETDAIGVLFLDRSGTIVDANEVFLSMTGYSRDEVNSHELTWRTLTPPEWLEFSEEQMRKLGETGRLGPYEKEYLRKDGSRLWMMFTGRRLDDDELVVEYCIDISDRKRAEMERELLSRELSHRVKNVFAVIQSLATQTAGRMQSVDTFREAFLGRLHALAHAHSMLLETDWRSIALDTLVENAVEAYRVDRPDVIDVEGELVSLAPKQGLGLSLVLHELGTNAVKYGALSHRDGRLRVFWRKEKDRENTRVRLRWEERGGPRVAPPTEKGFGSVLIERACRFQLNSSVELDYATEGLTCQIVFPLD
jgi:PAS domain S-box-containing protein